ncbi:hypothetical protein GE09DRAFT_1132407 [Coniochaeta sp. 2T2.1]|nr:hypothetical protein GE09DRAFT_1132407 [Coniochaeta sp. 2T2.1]
MTQIFALYPGHIASLLSLGVPSTAWTGASPSFHAVNNKVDLLLQIWGDDARHISRCCGNLQSVYVMTFYRFLCSVKWTPDQPLGALVSLLGRPGRMGIHTGILEAHECSSLTAIHQFSLVLRA